MSTYVPIQAITLSADTATVTFTNIPQTFTDLILVCNYGTSAIGRTGSMRFNNDSATNYSWRSLGGNGTSASSSGGSNMTSFYFTGQITGDGTALANVSTTHIQNYSNATTYKTALSRSNDAARYVEAAVGTWRSTSAINRIDVTRDNGTNWLSGSTFTLYGIGSGAPKAFGGDVVVNDGTYWYHAFRSSGTFTPVQNLTCDYMIIAGGGAGGPNIGGGGGAGGLRAFSSISFPAQSYTVTVGAGGTAAAYPAGGGNGTNSTLNTRSVTGGGGGGTFGTTYGPFNGGSGGGSRDTYTVGTGNAGSYSPVEGYDGAKGNGNFTSGGGGGASAVGGTAAGSTSGTGGAGTDTYNAINFSSWLTATSTGSSTKVGGGGGGGAYATNGTSAGTGGTGGGGTGTNGGGAATAGTANTGGGGGGGSAAGGAAGNGGSGLVIVRYAV